MLSMAMLVNADVYHSELLSTRMVLGNRLGGSIMGVYIVASGDIEYTDRALFVSRFSLAVCGGRHELAVFPGN